MNQVVAPPLAGLAGLTVVSFESRLAAPMADLIGRQGGTPVSAPALGEIPAMEHADAIEFAKALLDGRIDMVIWLSGVGARTLLTAIEGTVSRAEFLAALGRIPSIALGPKPQAVLRELGIPMTLTVPRSEEHTS